MRRLLTAAIALLPVLLVEFNAKVFASWTFYEDFDGGFSQSWNSASGALPTESLAPVRTYGIPDVGPPTYSFDSVDAASVITMHTTTVPNNTRMGFISDAVLSGSIGQVEARINTLDQGGPNIDGLFDLWLVNADDSSNYVTFGLFDNDFDTQRIWTYATSISDFDQSQAVAYQSNTWYKLRITQAPDQNLAISIWDDAGTTELASKTFDFELAALGSDFRVGFSQWMGDADNSHSLLSAVDYISASPVPEPCSLILFSVGLFGVLVCHHRRLTDPILELRLNHCFTGVR